MMTTMCSCAPIWFKAQHATTRAKVTIRKLSRRPLYARLYKDGRFQWRPSIGINLLTVSISMALVPSQVILSLVMIMACVIFPVTLAEDLKPAASGGEAQGRTFGLLGAGLLGAELATLGGFGGYGGYPGYGYG